MSLTETTGNIMNSLAFLEPTTPVQFPELRTHNRVKVTDLLAILKWGTGQILELSSIGLSFGCLYPHSFPKEWSMDILDAKGVHIKDIMVRKTWERAIDHPKPSTKFEVITGVEFIDLTTEQSLEINELFENIEYSHVNIMLEELEISGFRHPALL